MTEIRFNIARIVLSTETEGPFKRLAIWFQGCDKRCVGCCNPELQEIRREHIVSMERIIEIIKSSKEINNIEGITFLGGEPTLQLGLAHLANEIRKLGLGTILFTGKVILELSDELINSIDLIIGGEYDIKLSDQNRNLIGSTNQLLHHISDRYKSSESWFFTKRHKKLDVNISDGSLYLNGDVLN